MNAGRAVCAILLFLSGTAALAADPIELRLRAKGAITTELTLSGRADDMHHCALLGRSGEPQIYVLSLNRRQSDSLLDPHHPGFSLTAAGQSGETWTETAATAVVQVAIGGRRFIGFQRMDPDFRLRVSVRPDGSAGSFHAAHLVDDSGSNAIDLDGTWRCAAARAAEAYPLTPEPAALVTGPVVERAAAPPPGAQPSGQQQALPLPPSPVPAPPRAGHFRIVKTCQHAGCPGWQVTNLGTRKKFHASVDFGGLKLAPSVADAAKAATVELLVTGEEKVKMVNGKRHTTIHAQQLEGVMPRS